MTSTEYRRRPLPRHALPRHGWLALCFFALVFSPFAGFAIDGKVGQPGLMIGLVLALIPLSGLAAMAILRWRAWRQLPPDLAAEWTRGKLVPAEGAPTIAPPVRFSNKKCWIVMSADGLACSRSGVLSMQGVAQVIAKSWIADIVGEVFVPWADIAEWCVDVDSDGPDYSLLRLRSGGQIRVRRFCPDEGNECDILDAVRSVGKVPLRLRCDVDCG